MSNVLLGGQRRVSLVLPEGREGSKRYFDVHLRGHI